MSIGWMVDLAEANTYFTAERYVTADWDSLADADRTKALLNAYNRIVYCARFSIPAVPTAAQLVVLKYAQCEMAYYLIIHLGDEDHRKGLQAQGVISAGIVKEVYSKDMLEKIPIPPVVAEILEDFDEETETIVMLDVDRNEDESVDFDAVD